jgi:HPt (histidine-containing phosphotransfer) domain-containing protein
MKMARQAYRARLLSLADELTGNLVQGEGEETRAELKNLSHRLSGTAGCYGFDHVSAAAECLAEALREERAWAEVVNRTNQLARAMQDCSA